MAKISALALASPANGDELVPVVQDGETKAMRYDALAAEFIAAGQAMSNYRPTFAAAIADFPVDTLFTCDEGGPLSVYRRSAADPFYAFVHEVPSRALVDQKVAASELAAPAGDDMVGSDDAAGGTLWNTVKGFVAYLRSSAGASIVGFLQAGAGAVARSLQSKARERISVLDFIPVEYHAAILNRTATVNLAPYIQAALDYRNTSVVGSFQVEFPDGRYPISGSGTRILEVQNGTKIVGQSLEGTTLHVLPDSTAPYVIEDNGNAAKIEIYNLTVFGNNNLSITRGIRLGVRNIQFGTYGCLDNVSVREMPNAIAYELDCNIVACGKLYCLRVKDGLLSDAGGSGLYIEAFYPTDWSGVGATLALADHISYIEAEAPGSDDAVGLFFNRGGTVNNFYLAIGPNRQIRSPVKINADAVGDFFLGKTNKTYQDGTAKYGDTTSPDATGNAASGGANTLTDTTKTWARDQWRGAALHIVSGTGAGQFREVLSNTKDTLTIRGFWSTVPDVTSVYAMSYFIRTVNTGGALVGGYGHSDSFTIFHPWMRRVSVDQVTTDKLLLGKSNDAVPLLGISRKAATLDFASIPAHSTGAAVSVPFPGMNNAAVATVAVHDGLAANNVVYQAHAVADQVNIRGHNHSGVAVDPPVASFGVMVHHF